MAGPVTIGPRPPIDDLDEEAFTAWYGPSAGWRPADLVPLLAGAPFRWWVSGGWAIDDPERPARAHHDLDVAVLLDDLPAVVEHLRPLHCWEGLDGALRPLVPGASLSPGCEQLWVRAGATTPWLLDVVAGPSDAGVWAFKREPSIRLPLDEVGVVGADGLPRLRPEVVLLFKAKHRRPQDEADLARVLPTLAAPARAWLADAVGRAHPGHPWLAQVRA